MGDHSAESANLLNDSCKQTPSGTIEAVLSVNVSCKEVPDTSYPKHPEVGSQWGSSPPVREYSMQTSSAVTS